MRVIDARALRRLHVLTDGLLVSLGWLGAWALRQALDAWFHQPINPATAYVRALPMIVLPWLFCCWLFGIYRSSRMSTTIDELQALFRGVALGLLVVSAISFFVREFQFGRFVVLASAGLNFVTQGASRVLFHRLERRLHRSGRSDVAALIVGTGVAGIRLLQKLQDHPEIGYRVVGFLDESRSDEAKDIAGHPLLGGLDDAREIIEAHGVEEVFVAMPSLGHTRMLSLVLDCEDLRVTFRAVTNLFEVLTAGTSVDLVDELPLVRLGRERVSPFYAPAKRAFDLAASLVALLGAAPIMAWVALRIRATSPGPALFAQDRVGQGGRVFRVWKFRTMKHDVEPEAPAPRKPGDARITDYGRWLRATSLDELPQLWNVLRGDMSLVGPRPEMPFIVARYEPWQRRRLAVKPGITGLWQILGRKDLPMHENLQYDFYYIRNRSLPLDLSILIRTVGVVVSGKGAF
jgi:exopolysaccharide biosynthesis polyprenyl glycosylphosphotransferase